MRLLAAAAAIAAALFSHDVAAPTGWLVYGNDAQRTGSTADGPARFLRPLWTRRLPGRLTAQPLVVRDVPAAGERTIVVATSAGTLYALDAAGRERWHARFGRRPTTCPQLDGFGITGTPAIDEHTNTIYVTDAHGLLHARDVIDGREREGWPLKLFSNPNRELVWGASAIVGDSLYVPTGAICDRAIEGKVIRIRPETRELTKWVAVPFRLGGGGGIWGWGGVSYSAGRDSLLVVTGNALPGGSNVGKRFSESAGYGERLVELSRDLVVRAASHPAGINAPLDLDFTGSPVVLRTRRCGELVVAGNKNGRVYGWRGDAIARGPAWSIRPHGRTSIEYPLVSQLAVSTETESVLVATHTRLTRIVLATCRPRIAWERPIGVDLTNGSPTVAGGTVWLAVARPKPWLAGFDLATGSRRFSARLPRPAFVAPTVVDGRIYVVTMGGDVAAYATR